MLLLKKLTNSTAIVYKIYNIKELDQPKMSLNNREFIIWKERGRGVESKRGGQVCGLLGGRASRQAGIFKVRLGLVEIEGRDREIVRQSNKETLRQS
jgi:hypothetical protein